MIGFDPFLSIENYVSMKCFFFQKKIDKCSVPQGSNLGPFFLIYINDPTNALEKPIAKILLYLMSLVEI